MKNLIIFITFFLLFLTLLKVYSFAQSSNLYLAVTPYKTRTDLDILFSQSTRVLEYLEGEDVEEPIFLSLVTESQKNELLNKGFVLKILDNNTEISRYTLLYHPQPDQSNKLSIFGEVFLVSRHYTLLKMPSGKSFEHEGVGAEFFDIPFSSIISPPPLKTKTALSPIPSPTVYSLPNVSMAPSPSLTDKRNMILPVVIISVLALLVIIALFMYRFFRRKNIPYYD